MKWLLCFLFGINFLNAQNFGARIGSTIYHPRRDVAQNFPKLGIELAPTALFFLGEKPIALQTEFGYLLSHSWSIRDIYSPQSGNFVPQAYCDDYLNMITFAFGMKYFVDPNQRFSLLIQPELYYRISQFSRASYEAAVDYKIVERVDYELPGVPKLFYNLRLGFEMDLTPSKNFHPILYLHLVEQLDKPGWPAGAMVGFRIYFKPGTTSK